MPLPPQAIPKRAQLFWAMAISALVHAGLLGGAIHWGEGLEQKPGPRKTPTTAVSQLHWVEVEVGSAPNSAPSPAPAPRPPPSPPPKPAAKTPAPKAAPSLPKAAVTADSYAGLLPSTEELPVADDGAVGVADVDASAAAASSSSKGPPSSAPAEEDNALQQRLQNSAYGCYPARARRQRFEGTTHLAFCVDMQGMATQTRISKSSGYGSLDEAALECVVKKAQPLPPSSQGRCFVAPIAFRAGI